MAIELKIENVEIRIFTIKKEIHLTKLSKEVLGLKKLNSIRNKVNKDVSKIASEYEIHIFNGV